MPMHPTVRLIIILALLVFASLPGAADEPPRSGGMERIVVIDPGHGGRDEGVKSASGLLEKDIVLAVAIRLKETLEVNLGLKVILTRSGDFEVTALERAAMANQNKASLFVGLHLGSSGSQPADGFIAVYAEPKPEKESAGGGDNVFWRAWDGQNNPHRAGSRRLAGELQLALSTWLSREAAEPLGGDWLVLKGVGCPAAMVQLGCLSNPERERSYQESLFLDELARVLFRAVAGFLKGENA